MTAPRARSLAVEGPEHITHLLEQSPLLRLVDRFDRFENLKRVAALACRRRKRLHVLGKTAAAVADPWKQEGWADPPVEATTCRTASTFAPNRSHTLATSFMNDTRVASMALAAYLLNSALALSMTMIGAPVRVKGAYSVRISSWARGVFGTDHHAVRLQKVLHRGALLQELGVANDAERVVGFMRDHLVDAPARSHRHRALDRDDRVRTHRARQVAGGGQDVLHVCGPVLPGRGSHGDEDDLGATRGARDRRAEDEPFLGLIRRTSSSRPGS